LQSVTYQVVDLEKAKQWYRMVLEREPTLDAPFAVRFAVGEAVLTLVPQIEGSPEDRGHVVAYWGVEDADAAYERLLQCGATAHSELRTFRHTRVGKVVDPFGNLLGITSSSGDPQKQSVDHRPSESALGVVICRALAAREERAEWRGPDHLAEVFLAEDQRKLLADRASREWLIHKAVTPALYGFIWARTAFMDQAFTAALAARTPQIVFLGAGYDSRAYRFRERLGDTRVFELDARTTQERKRDLLGRSNVPIPPQLVFAPIDFKTEKIEEVLRAAGFDGGARTLFLWEGVTYYLTGAVVRSTLDCVRRNSGAGSTICFDYMTQARESVYAGEPFRFWIEPERVPSFLLECGFAVIDHLSPEDIEKQYLTPADGSSGGTTLPFFSLVKTYVQG
jgi:methyltransferase (TIGR00027 family)